ncbi:MAG: response regulator [Nitrospirota bacterium]
MEAKKKILLADDDKNFGFILKNELEDENYDVDLYTDGVEAVLGFISAAYDLVLLDVKMPRLDGISTLRIIKKLRPETPAVIFSGNATPHDMAESVQVGEITYFDKPFEIKALKSYIKNYIL